jgi:2-oxoglutarate ferredoxin oxidoreductase subunit delta
VLASEAELPQEPGALRASEVATPQEAVPRARNRPRGRVRVFRNWCKGCGLCIAFCPQGVFAANEQHQPLAIHQERCLVCQWCTIHCPDFAIVVQEIDSDTCEAPK